jgi:hypothetical protein
MPYINQITFRLVKVNFTVNPVRSVTFMEVLSAQENIQIWERWSKLKKMLLQTRMHLRLCYEASPLEGGEGTGSRSRPLSTPGKDPVPIVLEAGWAPGTVWTSAENLAPIGIRSPDRPARGQSPYWLSYPAGGVPNCLKYYEMYVVYAQVTNVAAYRVQSMFYRASRVPPILHKASRVSSTFYKASRVPYIFYRASRVPYIFF